MKAAELAIEALSDPVAAQTGAREMAKRSDLAPDDLKILRGILQPWWDNERDARALCSYLGTLGFVAGSGSHAHRRAVKIAILCARSALSKVVEQDRDEASEILDKLDAWARGEFISITLQDLRSSAWILWRKSSDSFGSRTFVANAADAASNVQFDAIASTASSAASAFANTTDYPPQSPEWFAVRYHHLSNLADMIRAAIPECPIVLQ